MTYTLTVTDGDVTLVDSNGNVVGEWRGLSNNSSVQHVVSMVDFN